jgi:hypothetical protein
MSKKKDVVHRLEHPEEHTGQFEQKIDKINKEPEEGHKHQ